MAGLDPAIHVPRHNESETWITGTSPVMTIECVEAYHQDLPFFRKCCLDRNQQKSPAKAELFDFQNREL